MSRSFPTPVADLLLCGFSNGGQAIHAVRPLPHDVRPLQHGHGRKRPALCGAVCAVKPWAWQPTRKAACKRCARIAA
jgi:hypothetical protein